MSRLNSNQFDPSQGQTRSGKRFHKKNRVPGHPASLRYVNEETREEYEDVTVPKNLGRRRPRVDEWGDYILEEQQHYLAGIASGEIELPPVRTNKSKARDEWKPETESN